MFTWGEKIIPLTVDAAKAWVESHLDGEEYEKIFDCVDEMDGKKSYIFKSINREYRKIKSCIVGKRVKYECLN